LSEAPETPADGPARRRRPFFGWYIVGASVLTNALAAAAFAQGFQPFIPAILNTFGWTRTQLSGAFSFRQVESGFVGPAIGFLVDRWGPKRVIIVGGIIVGAGVMALSQVQNLWQFYLVFLVTSVGFSGANHSISWPVLISRWFRRQRGRAVGIALTGPIIGGAMAYPSSLMIEAWDWRPVLFALGAVTLVGVTLVGLSLTERPEPRGYGVDGDPLVPCDRQSASQAPMQASERGLSAGQIIRTREFWLFSLFLGAMNISSNAFSVHQILYFTSLGMDIPAAALTAVILVVASGIGRVGAGALTDYVDYRFVLAGMGVMIATSQYYLLAVTADTIVMALPFALLMGIAFGGVISIRPVVASKLYGMRSLGAAIGMLNGATLASGVAGPLLMGIVFDIRGSYNLAIWITASIAVLAMVMLLFLRPIASAWPSE